jgi:UPF0755 protein
MKKRVFSFSIGITVIGLVIFVLAYAHFFGPVDPYAGQVQFVVQQDETSDQVADALKQQGFIRSRFAFDLALKTSEKGTGIRPGGYELSASMDMWSLAGSLVKPPYLVFFTFPPGWRKEQIADKLVATLGWTPAQEQEWLNVDTAPSPSYVEGVYYPDTYLIPSDQSPAEVAERFRDRFQSVFAPYANKAYTQNLSWTEVITLASLIQREAAGPDDMPLIAGIMFNRLSAHMPLQIDASLQYVVGTEANWWPVPTPADKSVKSPFNTYLHAGLPPHAIDEPSLTAINAVLNPTATDCLYYIHDDNRQIHCSATYSGQIANVDEYLK